MIPEINPDDLPKGDKMHMAFTAALCDTMLTMAPQTFKKFLCVGLLMNVLGNMKDKYWDEFINHEHCDKPDCHNCNVTKLVLPALIKLREYYKGLVKDAPDKFTQVDVKLTGPESRPEPADDKPSEEDRQSFSM